MENNKLKIGDIIFFVSPWTRYIEKAEITEIDPDEGVRVNSKAHVDKNGNEIERSIGTLTVRFNNIYATAAEAYQADLAKSQSHLQECKDEIKNLEDLVNFPLNHCINGDEYTDWEALQAYKDRALELLNYSL